MFSKFTRLHFERGDTVGSYEEFEKQTEIFVSVTAKLQLLSVGLYAMIYVVYYST